MTAPGPYRIGVVGLGVAGAAAAYLLARDGHEVTLLEQAPRLGPMGAGVLLQASGQEVMRRLGVLDEVAAHAAPIEELHARHWTGGTLIRTRFGDLYDGCRAYGVHRGVLFNALHSLVKTTAAEVRVSCRVVSRSVGPEGVWLGDECGERHGPFDFVV
ncbi:MAG: FAD-dependent monooxygenase, partial [Gemmataceae bacterium]|nr:FAD-dependent monooxygenase [Gemmataceae bacterium]